MNISICITVLNEEKSIGPLLDSLLIQTKRADEIVIVDGGSTDKTFDILRHLVKKDKRIKIVREPGNVAHGRNVGVEVAKNDIIATTDTGCIPHTDWLEIITHPFINKNTEIVAGYYDMHTNSPMQKVIGIYLGIHPNRYNPATYLPSTRSMAFKKQLWERVGGFNEKLDNTGEDTQFVNNIVKTGVKIIREEEARVDWKEIEKISFKEAMNKFINYAKGDVQTGIWWSTVNGITSHNIKVLLIFFRYLIGIILLLLSIFTPSLLVLFEILFVLYVFWSIFKWRDIIDNWKEILWLPVVQISSDFAVMYGFIYGLF